jgi:hypothetical protein
MKIPTSLIVALGFSGLAAIFVLLIQPDQTARIETSPNKSAQSQSASQKPAVLQIGQPDELPISADLGPPLSLTRFKSTRLSPDILKRDIELFSNSANGTAKEFREALSHHFPAHELSLGHTGPGVLQCLNEMAETFDGFPPERTNELGRVAPAFPLTVYIHRALNQSAPQDERNRFCRVVDSLVRMYGDHPNEQALNSYLFQIFGGNWTGWLKMKGQGATAASAIWRSSEVYRHLAYGEPPTSEDFKELVRINNRNSTQSGPRQNHENSYFFNCCAWLVRLGCFFCSADQIRSEGQCGSFTY